MPPPDNNNTNPPTRKERATVRPTESATHRQKLSKLGTKYQEAVDTFVKQQPNDTPSNIRSRIREILKEYIGYERDGEKQPGHLELPFLTLSLYASFNDKPFIRKFLCSTFLEKITDALRQNKTTGINNAKDVVELLKNDEEVPHSTIKLLKKISKKRHKLYFFLTNVAKGVPAMSWRCPLSMPSRSIV